MSTNWIGAVSFLLECGKSFAHTSSTVAKIDLMEKMVGILIRLPEVEAWPETKALIDSAKAYAATLGGSADFTPGLPTHWVLPAVGDYPGAHGGSIWGGPSHLDVGQ